MPKGLELASSPDWSIYRTFLYQFYFTNAAKISSIPKKTYRNPIFLAREYKKIIDSRIVKNQSELAKLKGISRARVTQILNLLKLNPLVIQELEKLGDSLKSKIITERMIRHYVNKSSELHKSISMQ